ncbi:hypothetical protein SDC9_121287 [bioreactor metagenome]|uniref:Uncharacterized protein n=1 Tax=bioreactor metagenome TaxID=1076179 RepID=A0A645CBJ5_9ZZZZ
MPPDRAAGSGPDRRRLPPVHPSPRRGFFRLLYRASGKGKEPAAGKAGHPDAGTGPEHRAGQQSGFPQHPVLHRFGPGALLSELFELRSDAQCRNVGQPELRQDVFFEQFAKNLEPERILSAVTLRPAADFRQPGP